MKLTMREKFKQWVVSDSWLANSIRDLSRDAKHDPVIFYLSLTTIIVAIGFITLLTLLSDGWFLIIVGIPVILHIVFLKLYKILND